MHVCEYIFKYSHIVMSLLISINSLAIATTLSSDSLYLIHLKVYFIRTWKIVLILTVRETLTFRTINIYLTSCL